MQLKSFNSDNLVVVLYGRTDISSLEISLELVHRNCTDNVVVLLQSDLCVRDKELRSIYPVAVADGFKDYSPVSNISNVLYGLKLAYENYKDCKWICFLDQEVIIRNPVKFNFPKDKDIWVIGLGISKVFCDKYIFKFGNGFPNDYYLSCNSKIFFVNMECIGSMINNGMMDKLLLQSTIGGENSFSSFNLNNLEGLLFPTLCDRYGKKWYEFKDNDVIGIRNYGNITKQELVNLKCHVVGPIEDFEILQEFLEISRARCSSDI
jgi:hypothetical protein